MLNRKLRQKTRPCLAKSLEVYYPVDALQPPGKTRSGSYKSDYCLSDVLPGKGLAPGRLVVGGPRVLMEGSTAQGW